jgi:hypothetical protein
MGISKIKRVTTGYTPRPLQAEIHKSLQRFNVLVLHRRFGKTVLSINEMVDRALRLTDKKSPQFAYIAPTYGQAKRVAWEYVKDFTRQIPGAKANEADLRVDIPRPKQDDKIRIMLLGAENPGSIRGIYLDGVVLDEYAEMDPVIWAQVIRPALADRQGWAIFIGTPKGQNHFYHLYSQASENKDWFVRTYRASETKVLPDSELDAAQREMSEEEYAQEFECSFTAALVGAYYGKILDKVEKDGRICNVPYDPNVPVDTFWDLGIGDTTAIWFLQVVGQEFRLIDYFEEAGQGLDFFVRELSKKPYIYREHTLPHDAKARELGTGKSREETLRALGLRKLYILPRWSVDDGIHAVRMLLPKCWFDKLKCKRGIETLRNYQRKWDSRNQMYLAKPKHDWASHGSDAFRYLAMGTKPEGQRTEIRNLPRTVMDEYDYFN